MNQNLKEKLASLICLDKIVILACDVSYRHTGICVLSKTDGKIKIEKASCIDNPVISYGFEGYSEAAMNMNNVCKTIKIVEDSYKADILVCEMPTYGRSMNAGMAIGICWGSIMNIDPHVIPPTLLKKWSSSKRGDKKEKVLDMVKSRVHLDSYSDDNIVDAVGTAIMISDWITLLKYEANK